MVGSRSVKVPAYPVPDDLKGMFEDCRGIVAEAKEEHYPLPSGKAINLAGQLALTAYRAFPLRWDISACPDGQVGIWTIVAKPGKTADSIRVEDRIGAIGITIDQDGEGLVLFAGIVDEGYALLGLWKAEVEDLFDKIEMETGLEVRREGW